MFEELLNEVHIEETLLRLLETKYPEITTLFLEKREQNTPLQMQLSDFIDLYGIELIVREHGATKHPGTYNYKINLAEKSMRLLNRKKGYDYPYTCSFQAAEQKGFEKAFQLIKQMNFQEARNKIECLRIND